MEQSEDRRQNFEITIEFNGSIKKIMVKPEETTDGAEYFKCSDEGNLVSQIREEKDGKWEQIWGELDMEMVELIGSAINEHRIKSL